MASTSNGGQIPTQGVNGMPDNYTFDWNQGLADTALRRDGPRIYKYLEDPECKGSPFSTSPMFRNSVNGNEPYRAPEYEGWVPGGPPDTNSVPMQLLHMAEQERAGERADLLVIYPAAKVEGNCITTAHYLFVVKRLLSDLKVSDVRHPDAYARLLRRLSSVLRSVPTLESDDFSNPADCDGCLGQLLTDMEECIKTPEPWGPDGYVYVHRGTDTYVQCLLAAAADLNSS